MDILLVEDDPEMSQFFQLVLAERGHNVIAFADGESAWQGYQQQHFSMVILDWLLPDMDGLEVCRNIRNSTTGKGCLILVITARTHPGDLEQVLAAGADDYLAKPVELGQLKIRLSIAEQGVISLQQKNAAETTLKTAAVTFETHEGIIVTDENVNIVRVNQAFSDITGYQTEEILGQNPSFLKSGRHNKTFYAKMWETLLQTGEWSGEIWDKRKDGEIYPCWSTITTVKDDQQKITNYVAIFSDITERKQTEVAIHSLAFYDALTALPNRRLFHDRLSSALHVSARRKDYGAVLFIDLDKFKLLNDTLGHDYGDMLLVDVGARLKSSVRVMDTVARYGGDEFVVLIESVSKEKDDAIRKVALVAEKIRTMLATTYKFKEHEYHTSPSIGVSVYHGVNVPVADLIEQADRAMYEVKKSGRNAVSFFDPVMQKEVVVRKALVNDLQQENILNQLQLYYQIQVDQDNRPLGAEVFLRWIHPEHGILMPAQFLTIAEESGMIIDIDHWVLDMACQQLALWQREDKKCDLTLTVNVSAKYFSQHDLVSKVADILKTNQVEPRYLKLELSERLVLSDINNFMDKIQELKAMGVRLSMDNFGTVYSSLSNLAKISSDQLKIKYDFVQGVLLEGNDTRLVQTIVDLAKSLSMEVFAEGVETEAQRQYLRSQNCNSYQGYFFGKPVVIEEFDVQLAR